MNKQIEWKKYIIVFFITLGLFVSAILLSSFLNDKKITQLKTTEDKIYVDILSSEVQFSLLQELSCKDVSTTALSSELNSLAEKITYSENNIGVLNENVISLKKYYSLLQIKDYLLMKKITERCGQKSVFVLYFYSNDECDECTRQGYVLTSLRETYPNLRVYSFDYNLDLSALKAMISIYKVPSKLPALVINGKIYSGFQTIEDIQKNFPELKTLEKVEVETTEKSDTKESTKDTKTKN